MSPSKPDVCIYHGPGCMDGLVAGWAIWKRWPDIEFRAAQYGQEPVGDVDGAHLLLVDFSYKHDALLSLASRAASVTILDHHKTAQADLAPFRRGGLWDPIALAATWKPGENIQARFDMDKSGARLAWEYAYGPDFAPPPIVRYVEDRDLWRFRLGDFTRQLHAVLSSDPETFAVVDAIHAELEIAGTDNIAREGAALLRQFDKDVSRLIEVARQVRPLFGHQVPVANAPPWMASDVGNVMARGHPFAAVYYQTKAGRWSFSLRSTDEGLDVSEIAAAVGGGGHRNAAGFLVDELPWRQA